MQSLPYYQQGGYQAASPYPATASPAVSSVMNNAAPMMGHATGLPPLHPGLSEQSSGVSIAGSQAQKRKQVKNACTNCQKACKKCDDARPCPRCVKYGIADTCVNSVRKERKKGIKRGPYKRRQKSDEKTGVRKHDGMDPQQPQQYNPAAMRSAPMPFGYPSNLNQYGQPPYDLMMMQPSYVVNSVYPPMGYPMLVPGQNDNTNGQHPYQQQHSAMTQHYNTMIHHSPHTTRPLMHGDHFQQQQQQQQQQASQNASPQQAAQLMTPIASTSTSSTTSTPPAAADEEEGSKFARLSQLCSAALHHTGEHARTESNHSQP
ncbi:hypothetical protein BDF14DRAFT_1741910 [Spinellus fusiger]|nr:hypothetical protein BDF14DRAFT_1741910 [Spinellus fusiger]